MGWSPIKIRLKPGDDITRVPAWAWNRIFDMLDNCQARPGLDRIVKHNAGYWLFPINAPPRPGRFRISVDSDSAIHVGPGTGFWFNDAGGLSEASVSSDNIANVDPLVTTYIHLKLLIGTGGNGTWSLVASTTNLVGSSNETARYWLLGEVASLADGAGIIQRISSDIYEHRAA